MESAIYLVNVMYHQNTGAKWWFDVVDNSCGLLLELRPRWLPSSPVVSRAEEDFELRASWTLPDREMMHCRPIKDTTALVPASSPFKIYRDDVVSIGRVVTDSPLPVCPFRLLPTTTPGSVTSLAMKFPGRSSQIIIVFVGSQYKQVSMLDIRIFGWSNIRLPCLRAHMTVVGWTS